MPGPTNPQASPMDGYTLAPKAHLGLGGLVDVMF